MKTSSLLLVIGMGVVLVLALIYSWNMWTDLGGVQMSGHGWAAIALGVVFGLALGGGLMFLVFYSHRKGYDRTDE